MVDFMEAMRCYAECVWEEDFMSPMGPETTSAFHILEGADWFFLRSGDRGSLAASVQT